MKSRNNFLKVLLAVMLLFLFLLILEETSKLSEMEVTDVNETNETLIENNLTVTNQSVADITVNKTVNITNETKREIDQEKKINQDQTKTYIVNSKLINVTLDFVVREYAVFVINGEKTDQLGLGDTYTTKQGITIAVLDIWVQDFEGGRREVDFLLG